MIGVVIGRKMLAALNDVANAVFKKAKSNPGLETPEKETSNFIAIKMIDDSNANNHVLSDRTMS